MENLSAQIFLLQFKTLLEEGKIEFAPRNNKTSNFLFEHELNVEDAYNIIRQLKPSNYFKGPEDDHNGKPGNVMMFLYNYDDIIIYIKLKIWTDKQGNQGAVMSFHEEGNYD